MRSLPALVLAVILVWLSPAFAGVGEEGAKAAPASASEEALGATVVPVVEVEESVGVTDRTGDTVFQAFLAAARVGAREARPLRPRTVNARGRWPDLEASPPAPGEGRRVTVQAYAYHLRGFTARGTYTRMGTVAVDPGVVPLGSKVYIPGYGWGRAVDTGGAIQGRKIDVWFPTYSQCMQWGVRTITITVVP